MAAVGKVFLRTFLCACTCVAFVTFDAMARPSAPSPTLPRRRRMPITFGTLRARAQWSGTVDRLHPAWFVVLLLFKGISDFELHVFYIMESKIVSNVLHYGSYFIHNNSIFLVIFNCRGYDYEASHVGFPQTFRTAIPNSSGAQGKEM